MKPTERVAFAFDYNLVICLRDAIEGGELQLSFEEPLRLKLEAEGVQSLLFLASQIQKEHSRKDLLIFS